MEIPHQYLLEIAIVKVDRWIRYVVNKLRPFQVQDSSNVVQGMEYEDTSVQNSLKYLDAQTEWVGMEVSAMIAQALSLVLNGFGTTDMHLVEILPSFRSDGPNTYSTVLLALYSLIHGEKKTFEKHLHLFNFLFHIFLKFWRNFVVVTGDNCANSRIFALFFVSNLIGYTIHRFNLYSKYIADEEKR